MSFRSSVEEFEADNDWLSDSDAPALTTLYAVADALDKGPLQAAMVSQFGLYYRALLKRKPTGEPTKDPLQAALDAASS